MALTPLQIEAEEYQAYTRREIEASSSIRKMATRMIRLGKRPATISDYIDKVRAFCKNFLGLPYDEAISSPFDWEEKINAYLDDLAVRNFSQSYVRGSLSAIRRWLSANNVKFEDNIETPKKKNKERDRVPTRDELRRILHPTGIALKVQALLAISSGMRMGAILRIQFKNVDLNDEIPLVIVPDELSKGTKAYVTFLTPEVKQLMTDYVNQRKEHGETITPDSYLVVSERPWGHKIGKPAAELRWQMALKIAGLDMRSVTHRILHFHTLRKYFETWCKISGIESDTVKAWMGHRSDIVQVYFASGIESLENQDLIREFRTAYKKCVPALTIFSDQAQLEEVKTQLSKQEQELKARLEESEARNSELRELSEKDTISLNERIVELERDRENDKKVLVEVLRSLDEIKSQRAETGLKNKHEQTVPDRLF